mgnify:CR=1 FL=1
MGRLSMKLAAARLSSRVEAATKLALDQSTAAMVIEAKGNHPWQNVTGKAEGSIQMRPAAENEEGVLASLFGSFMGATDGGDDESYFIFLELGTVHMREMPTLRPAFDQEAPKLAGRIRANLEGGSDEPSEVPE